MKRNYAEKVLLAEAVERGIVEFLEEKDLRSDSFWAYRGTAQHLWKIYKATGRYPTRTSMKAYVKAELSKTSPSSGLLEDWEPYSEHPDNRLVIIDTLKMWKSNKSSNKRLYEQDYESVAPLRDLAQKHNTAILVIHHNNKAESTDNPFDAISGSTGLLGATNTNIVLQKLKNGKGLTFNIAGHDIENFGKYALIYDPMTWTFKLDDNPEKYETSEERTEIIEFIREAGEPQSPKDVGDFLGKVVGN